MTAIFDHQQETAGKASFQLWRCADCRCFHLKAGAALMTFSPQEFASLTREVVECYSRQICLGEDLAATAEKHETFQTTSETMN